MAWRILWEVFIVHAWKETYIILAHIPFNKIAFMTIYDACTFLSQLELSLEVEFNYFLKKKRQGFGRLNSLYNTLWISLYNFVVTCFMALNIVNFHENCRYARKYCIYDSFYLIILVNYVNLNCHVFNWNTLLFI